MARVRRLLLIGALAGIAYLVWRWQRTRTEHAPPAGLPGSPQAGSRLASPSPTLPSEQPPSGGAPAPTSGPRPVPTRVHRGPPPAPGAKSPRVTQSVPEAAPPPAEETPGPAEISASITPPPVERPAETAATVAEISAQATETPVEEPAGAAEASIEELRRPVEITPEDLATAISTDEQASTAAQATKEAATEAPAEEAEARVETPAEAALAAAEAAMEAAVEVESLVAREVAGTTATAPVEALVEEAPPAESFSLVNINTADYESLVALPGIGPALAQRIIAYREEHGPFTSVEQLQEVQGIGPRNLDEFRHLITV
ncbi:MAG: helix-hairpin-helix domain-containing protein [Oscillochloridaceae bacterium]|nr:helix-hairpin-helix domain-containing protein [Chloroflexaceae bacterium]MDW8388544.1 helix-hairpin-helix domain-containing protein [Oscillochloridaceae bacterium]